jgi:hypothetical protein
MQTTEPNPQRSCEITAWTHWCRRSVHTGVSSFASRRNGALSLPASRAFLALSQLGHVHVARFVFDAYALVQRFAVEQSALASALTRVNPKDEDSKPEKAASSKTQQMVRRKSC